MNYTIQPVELSHDEVELFRPLLAQAWRDVSHDELRGLAEDALSRMTVDEAESFLNSLKNVNWGGVASGALGGAIPGATAGTAFGPWGTAIGAGLGALAGGLTAALGSGGGGGAARPASRPAPAQVPARPAPRPRPVATAPVQPTIPVMPTAPATPAPTTPAPVTPDPSIPTMPAPTPPFVSPGPASPAGPAGPLANMAGSAVGVLTNLLQDPQIIQSLLSLVMQQRGQGDLRIGDVRVGRKAVLNAIGALIDQMSDEAAQYDGETTPAAYLQDEAGRFVVDPTDRYARAQRLIDLVRDSGTSRVRDARATADQMTEAIIRPLTFHILRLSRFRAGVSNTNFFPFSGVCHLHIQMDRLTSGMAVGTGFYIDRNRILTAGHNVFHRTFGRATRMVISPGRNRFERPFGQFEIQAANMVTHPRWAANPTSADFDLAILRVTTPPPLGRTFQLATMPPAVAANGVAVLGYAADTAAGVNPNDQNIDFDTIRSHSPESFTYSLHTTGGTSGSPVIHVAGSDIQSIGVHSRTHSDTANQGCRLTDDKIRWIRGVTDEGVLEPDRSVLFDLDPRDAVVLTRTGIATQDELAGISPVNLTDAGLSIPGLEELLDLPATRRLLDLRLDEEAALAELDAMGVLRQ